MDNKENAKKFIIRTQTRVKEAVDPIALEVLAKMLNDNLLVHDLSYIEARFRQIMEEKLRDFAFEDQEILEKRKSILRKAIKKASKKIAPLSQEELTEDLTGERNKRCEKICQFIAYKLIDAKLAESDDEYLRDAISQDDELLVHNRLRSLADGLFEIIYHSIDQSYIKSTEKLWGKFREEIALKDVEGVLTKK